MTPALPALLVALLGAPDPAQGRASDGASSAGSARATVPGARVRCDGRAAPRLHEETANVSVTRVRTERAAREDAVRACLAAVRALPLAEGTVGDRLARDPQLERQVEDVVRAVRPNALRLFSDGGVALRLSVPLDGALSRLLVQRDTWTPAKAEPAAPRSP